VDKMTKFSQNITKTLFNLVNSNSGLFKSTKQADFILSNVLDNIHVAQQRHVFGDHQGCVRITEYTFFMDQSGVSKVVKTSKTQGKQSVYFDRNDKTLVKTFADKTRTKQQRQIKANAINVLRSHLDQVEALKTKVMTLSCEYAMTLKPEQMKGDVKLNKMFKLNNTIKTNLERLEKKYTKLLNEY